MGVTNLDDLLQLPRARGPSHYPKIALTEGLPRRPGVYMFRDRNGSLIYVGKAANLGPGSASTSTGTSGGASPACCVSWSCRLGCAGRVLFGVAGSRTTLPAAAVLLLLGAAAVGAGSRPLVHGPSSFW